MAYYCGYLAQKMEKMEKMGKKNMGVYDEARW